MTNNPSDSDNNVPSNEKLYALAKQAETDAVLVLRHCEETLTSPSRCLFALIIATTSLAKAVDMDIHSLISGTMAAYKGTATLVVLDGEADYSEDGDADQDDFSKGDMK
jgi:hypothetical protein